MLNEIQIEEDEIEVDMDDMTDPAYWDREADKMQRIADYYTSEGKFGKAEYHRQYVANFRAAAARRR